MGNRILNFFMWVHLEKVGEKERKDILFSLPDFCFPSSSPAWSGGSDNIFMVIAVSPGSFTCTKHQPPHTPPVAKGAINSADRGSSCNLHLTYSSVSCRSSTIEWFVRSAGMSAVTEEQRARDKVADTGDEDWPTDSECFTPGLFRHDHTRRNTSHQLTSKGPTHCSRYTSLYI